MNMSIAVVSDDKASIRTGLVRGHDRKLRYEGVVSDYSALQCVLPGVLRWVGDTVPWCLDRCSADT